MRKYYCKACHHYFYQPLPGIGRYQRASERLKAHVSQLHRDGLSQKCLSERLPVGYATVERWYHHYYQRKDRMASNRDCPRVLGIDEHFFSHKKRFATTLCDLHKHRVFDILPGRSRAETGKDLLSLKARLKVRVVCMDLSSTYRNLVRTYFPQALIVADRFHVIHLIGESFMSAYKQFDTTIKSNRGILASLRKHPDRLTKQQAHKCQQFCWLSPIKRGI